MCDKRALKSTRSLEANDTVNQLLEANGTELLEANGAELLEANGAVFLNDIDRSEVRKRAGHNLPHWTVDGAIYHVRFSLADSVPADIRRQLLAEKERLLAHIMGKDSGLTTYEKRRLLYLYSDKIDKILDAGYGSCWLGQESIAELVSNALGFFEGVRYTLFAWCLMPNHVHVTVQPVNGIELPDILHSWKSYTSNKANEILGRVGKFWQREYFDHIIRDLDDFKSTVDYVYLNPEKAGLGNWEWRWKWHLMDNFLVDY